MFLFLGLLRGLGLYPHNQLFWYIHNYLLQFPSFCEGDWQRALLPSIDSSACLEGDTA